jgi:GNAT superfamily N-acetyltransferase
VIVDRRLIHDLESTAALAALDIVESLQHLPDTAASAKAAYGGALVAMGPGRYVNRAVGVTLEELGPTDVAQIESFYGELGLPAAIELMSWAPASTVATLAERGYTTRWFRGVFASPVVTDMPYRTSIQVHAVESSSVDTWLDAFAQGTGVDDVAAREVSDEFGRAMVSAAMTQAMFATIDGTVVGCAAVQIAGDVAWLGSAATLPEYRGQGVQAALIAHRLRAARRAGCKVGAATAIPSGDSARNLIRLGFQATHTQAVVQCGDVAPVVAPAGEFT